MLPVLLAFTVGFAIPFATSTPWHALAIIYLLIPPIWATFKTRLTASVFIFGCMASSIWELLPGIQHYLGATSFFKPFFIYTGSVTLLSLPWWICWPNWRLSRWRLWLFLSLLFLVITLPPLGNIYPSSPLVFTGLLYPGFGLLGFVMVILLWLWSIDWIRFRHRSSFYISLVILIIGMAANLFYSPPTTPKNWHTYTMSAKKMGNRRFFLKKKIEQTKKPDKHSVFILPENFFISANPHLTQLRITDLMTMLKNTNFTLVAGIYQLKPHAQYVLVATAKTYSLIPASQPVPILSWHPGSKNSIPNRWWTASLITVDQQTVWLSSCFENFLVWQVLLAFTAPEKPKAIIGVSNLWWSPLSLKRKQDASLELFGRLFHVPVLQAAITK